jgi:hypothetical protein
MITLFNQAKIKFRIMKYYLMLPALTLIITMGCNPNEEILPVIQNDRIEVINDEIELNKDLNLKNDTIQVINTSAQPNARIAADFDLILVGEVQSTSIEEYQLQSTAIALDCQKAIISFNVAGNPYKGGITVLSIKDEISITSFVKFFDADIHNINFSKNEVYAATGTSNTVENQTAVLEILNIENNHLNIDNTTRIGLGSYAANCVTVTDDDIFVTTGDNENIGGGVYKVNITSREVESNMDLHDARWIDHTGQELYIVQGTPGKYSVLDQGILTLNNEVDVNGMDIPESKSTIEIQGNMAFIAAGSAGVQIYNILNHSLIGEIPVPDPSNPDMLTNAVAYDKCLLFISNGAGGVYVAKVLTDVNQNASSCETELLGYLDFDSMASVNHIAFKGDYLFVAAGLDGVKIVKVVRN